MESRNGYTPHMLLQMQRREMAYAGHEVINFNIERGLFNIQTTPRQPNKGRNIQTVDIKGYAACCLVGSPVAGEKPPPNPPWLPKSEQLKCGLFVFIFKCLCYRQSPSSSSPKSESSISIFDLEWTLTSPEAICILGSGTSASSVAAVSGTKRAVDSVAQEVVAAASVVVGWLPIRAYRMKSLANQAKILTSEEDETCEDDKFKDTSKKKVYNGSSKNKTVAMEKGHLGFVKVNMDGLPIGRKVDLNAHTCYETLSQALKDMFFNPTTCITSIRSSGESEQARKASKLLNGSSEFVLTYEDKEGGWMLIGNVPWEMFLNTVKRLRIMKTSEANGVGT
ncbi:auxin-responsive protein IAA13-like [Malania oleifera]|uniref:auxin-responsive protein IAA13-like n=1 Tax=Malania oleifera TaxID=397392 RepID=UPI0025ADFEB7|nr:auxin-responsive protein IAA13-like [Malania oleifera]